MIDFIENIESLEKMVWNFILSDDSKYSELRPSGHDSLLREELILMIKPSYFNTEIHQNTYSTAYKFFKEYDKIPNRNELWSYLSVLNIEINHDEFLDLYSYNLLDFNYDYLYKYIKSFILLKNLNITLVDILSFLKTTKIDPKNIDSVTEKVRNHITSKLAINFSSGDMGLNFFNSDSHIQIPKNGTPTGFKFFDKVLGGGWNAKALVVFQGRPKVGKSMVLGNLAARSVLSGNMTGLVTVELPERQYMKRIGSNLLNIKSDEYAGIVSPQSTEIVKTKLKELYESNSGLGDLYVKEFATGGATAIDIENYFLRLESKLNKKFKIIVVDYLNLLKPIKDSSGLYEKIKMISEELRGVAMRNEWCVITATQIRREDVDNFDLGMESVAESFGLIHTVDTLFGLMRSPLESRMKIKVIANRDNGYEESYKFYTMHKDYFRLSEENGLNSEFYSDDEETNKLEDEVRNSYTTDSSQKEIDYDSLLESM